MLVERRSLMGLPRRWDRGFCATLWAE